ncbi:MAG: glycosyltransferase [Erysipelotrichaceae bacterium]|nr:glycosyltransferase [Erysipelotrichaceae bacterium]
MNKCIDSVLAQSFTDFELLIIDNASTDHTVDVIRTYKDKRIRLVINEKNIGQTGSLNKGLDLAKGKYIARIDSDDLMLENRLKMQVAYMEEHPECGFCGSMIRNITEDDVISKPLNLCVSDEGLRLFQGVSSCIYHPAVMYRTEILHDNGIYYDTTLKIAEDYEIWDRLLKVTKGYNIPEVLTLYRVGDNKDSVRFRDVKSEEYFEIRTRICKEDMRMKYALESIKYEKKKKKTLLDCYRIYRCLNRYLNDNMSTGHSDYTSLRSCVYSRIYMSCALENEAAYAVLLQKLFSFYSKMKYGD